MVRIAPVTLAWAEALAEGDAVFSERFDVPVEPGWSGFPETLPLMLASARSGNPAEWGPHLFFDDDGALAGNGGWKGAPVWRWQLHLGGEASGNDAGPRS
jgi:hypothetical protein